MNINDLKAFLELTKDLNMTAAARRLYISQQALSLKIQKLERQYGVTLFERRPRLHLTLAGEALAKRAQAIVEENERLVNELSDISDSHAAVLRVGIPASRAAACLPDAVSRYAAAWPNVTLRLFDEPTPRLLQLLQDEKLELSVVVADKNSILSVLDSISLHLLFSECTYLVVSDELLKRYAPGREAELLARSRNGVDLRDFARFPFLLQAQPLNLRRLADDCFSSAGIKPWIYCEATNTELILAAYPSDAGCFFCRGARLAQLQSLHPGCHALPLLNNGELVTTNIYLAQKRYLRSPKYVQDFARFITDQFPAHQKF